MSDDYDLYGNFDMASRVTGEVRGGVLRTHSEEKCAGEYCCLHNPSEHALYDARLVWRADRYLMERVCSHGIGHPDPDDLAFKKRTLGLQAYNAMALEVHGCDGCC